MTTSPITVVLNAVLTSIHELVPIEVEKPSTIGAPLMQTEHGVLVGLVGTIKGRLFILGEREAFAQAGLAMYGMTLSGEMLDSFVGEFGNSVAGHTATILYDHGLTVDITPPTTMQGQVKFSGFSMGIQVPFRTQNGAQGQLVLAVEGV